MNIRLISLLSLILLLGCSSNDVKEIEKPEETPEETPEVVYKVVIDNPYKDVNWAKAQQKRSTSHVHITNQAGLDRAKNWGYDHLPVSSYYPSTPYYPIKDIKQNQFKVKQNFGVVKIENGVPVYIEGPINWNEVIMDKVTGWYDKLPKAKQNELPFKEGDYIFKNVPDNIIFSPNAEHHSFANTSGHVHINSVGSLYSSGTFDQGNEFKTAWEEGSYSYGAGWTWQDAFQLMIDQLLFEDGGGITINHPYWTNQQSTNLPEGNLPKSLIEEMLDFDKRVLGMEILSAGDWNIELWDDILKTGRQCLGFFVPDWAVQSDRPHHGGFNILLVDEFTEHSCLKAYRNGAFFGSQFGSKELVFKNISIQNDQLLIETNSTANFTITTDLGSQKFEDISHVAYKIPYDLRNLPKIKYIRVEANNGNERIFSQPIRFIIEEIKD